MRKAEKNILSATALSIGYPFDKGNTVVASDINITLQPGKLISLIGPNGIGKSTLLRTLSGIQQPLSGEVLLNGKKMNAYNPSGLAQNLSLVLTDRLPPSNLTVFELVALGRQPYTNWLGKLSAEDHQKVNDAIALTETGHLAGKKHFEISDGQLQKVLIARALAQDTPLVILDEPTTHLDLLHKVSVFKLLQSLAASTNKSILFSTHDIELAVQLSDEMIVMTPGSVVQNTPKNLIADGAFDRLFKDSALVFDREKGKFIVKD